jgi:hypothetical protein
MFPDEGGHSSSTRLMDTQSSLLFPRIAEAKQVFIVRSQRKKVRNNLENSNLISGETLLIETTVQ